MTEHQRYLKMLRDEGRDMGIVTRALKSGCVAGLPGAGAFRCPICGGRTWGTWWPDQSKWPQASEGVGYCSGWNENGRCDFEWLRSDDAWVFWPSDESFNGMGRTVHGGGGGSNG